MKFSNIRINNFLTIGHAWLDLKDKGLVLIRGVNADDTSGSSNGAGKSSIADALCWGLFGQTARGESGDAVVNITAKKECYVVIEFMDGATAYQITRYRKHAEFKNQTVVKSASTEGALWEDISKATERDTQALIEKIIGCSYDVFMASIYAGQEQMPDIPAMTPKMLKTLIEEAAGIKRIEAAYKIALKRRLEAGNGVSDAQTMVRQASDMLTREEANKISAMNNHAGYIELRNTKHAAAVASVEAGKKSLAVRIAAFKKHDVDAAKKRLTEIDASLSDRPALEAEARRLQKVATDASSALGFANMHLERAVADAKGVKAHIDAAPSSVGKPCSSCGKPHTEADMAEVLRLLEEKRSVKLAEIRELKAKADAAKELHVAAAAAAESYIATMPDVSVSMSERSKIDAMLREVEAEKAAILREGDVVKRTEADAGALLTVLNPYDMVVKLSEDAIVEWKGKLEKAEARLETANTAYEIADNVSKVFGATGVGAHILDTVTPFLNEATSDYLSALSDGNITAVWTTLTRAKGGDLKEKFTIEVENSKGASSFKGLSGGEKRKVRIACMLALQDLVSSRATKPIDLFIGDEIDDALDAAGLERLMGVLERKARERGTALIISHAELRDWIDQEVVVTKTGGYSVVEGVLCL